MRRGITTAAVVIASTALLSGCVAAPLTTLQRADGSTVTLDWAAYPGHAHTDADDVIAASAIDDIEAHGRAFMDAVRSALADELGIRLAYLDIPAEWQESETNGYGGESLLTTYVCCSLRVEDVPEDYDDWVRAYEIVADLADEYGAGPLLQEQDLEWMRTDPELRAEFEETWATGVPGEYSLLSAWTPGTGQSVFLSIEDPHRRLKASAEEKAVEPSISIGYSATVVEPGRLAEFSERVARYAGADKPDSTEWD